MIVKNPENDLQFLRSENLKLRNDKKWISERYIELFISYVELLDDYMPEWKFYCKDKIDELLKMVR